MEKKVYPINYFDSHPQNLVYVKELKKKILAEFIGTFSLVFAGTGAIVVNSTTKSLTHVGIAITFGLIVLALIYSFGYVSGAHFNPAVTLAFWYLKRIKLNEALLYILIQFSSATCASIILRLLFGNWYVNTKLDNFLKVSMLVINWACISKGSMNSDVIKPVNIVL
ncbi:MIP/aquaporin family protein, partial [Priestia flexa]